MNQVVLVGRVSEKLESSLIIAINRNYKNSEGIYVTDFIQIDLADPINSKAKEYLLVGDVIGVKGRLETSNNKIMVVKAEKLTFLSTKKED